MKSNKRLAKFGVDWYGYDAHVGIVKNGEIKIIGWDFRSNDVDQEVDWPLRWCPTCVELLLPEVTDSD